MTTKHEKDDKVQGAAESDAPVVTVAKGLEGPGSMVTTTAPALGAEIERPKPWTAQTPLPGQKDPKADQADPKAEHHPKTHG